MSARTRRGIPAPGAAALGPGPLARRTVLATILLLAAALASAPRAAAQGATLLTLADTTLFPEGIVRDAARARWIISSVRRRTIVAVDDAGRVTPWARDLPAGVGAILGLQVDAARGTLYAASGALPPMLGYTADDTLRAEVLEFDLATGALRRRIALPAAPRQRVPGDLAIARDGTLYVTDGLAARIYVVPPEGEVRVMTSPLFRSPQGVVLTPAEDALVVADYSSGFLHVPLAGDDTVAMVTDTAGRRLQGIDGLYWHRGALIATYNGRLPGRVMRVTLTPDHRRIASAATLETVAGAGEPTLGTVIGDEFVFIANSPWSAFDEKGGRKPGTVLAPPEIRRLLLPK